MMPTSGLALPKNKLKLKSSSDWPAYKRRMDALIAATQAQQVVKQEGDGGDQKKHSVAATTYLYLQLMDSTDECFHYMFDEHAQGDFDAVWHAFVQHFDSTSQVSLNGLMEQLFISTLHIDETITSYIGRVELTARRINQIEADTIKEKQVWFIIKKGLPERFHPFTSVVDQDEGITLAKGKQKLVDFDEKTFKAREAAHKREKEYAATADTKSKETCRNFMFGTCRWGDGCRFSHCGEKDPKNRPQDRRKCFFCDKRGHAQQDCKLYKKAKADIQGSGDDSDPSDDLKPKKEIKPKHAKDRAEIAW